MKVGILYKKEKVKDESVVPNLARKLKESGHRVSLISCGADIRDMDVLIVLGGDGALLHAGIIAGQRGIRVLGINYGTLGFLSEFEAKDTLKVVDLLNGEYSVLPRTVLKISVDDRIYYALNECILQRDFSRSHGNQVAEIGICSNGEKIQDITADGVIVATPTGSTAYSMSAGGCILAPDVKAFIITPVCAMGLRTRPFILSDDKIVSFDVSKEKYSLRLCADGRPIATVSSENSIRLEKANFNALFITGDVNNLFKKIKTKLSGI